jgi:hypothetical protein
MILYPPDVPCMGFSMSSINVQQRHLSSFLTFFPILLFDPSGAHPFIPTRGALIAALVSTHERPNPMVGFLREPIEAKWT